jgi:hypothetical protein
MRASVMSVVSLAGIVASRAGDRLRRFAASVASVARSALRGRGQAQACADAIASVHRAAAARAERPLQACTALLLRLGRAIAFRTEGERTQAYLAFAFSFVITMTVGAVVLSFHGPRTYRTAPKLAAERPAGRQAVAPGVFLLPRSPSVALPLSVALPRLTSPSKRTEEDVRLLTVGPAGQPQAANIAVRSTGSVRTEVARVTEITLGGNSSKPWVSITASAPVTYQLRNVEPDWVVIDVPRAALALTSGKPPAGRGLVRLIRVGQFTPDTVRVVLELTEAVPIHIATSAGKTAIVVSLAVDDKGNSHMAPAPDRQPGATHSLPTARSRTENRSIPGRMGASR